MAGAAQAHTEHARQILAGLPSKTGSTQHAESLSKSCATSSSEQETRVAVQSRARRTFHCPLPSWFCPADLISHLGVSRGHPHGQAGEQHADRATTDDRAHLVSKA